MVLTRPTNLRELRQFIARLIYYRKYISNFNELTSIFFMQEELDLFEWCNTSEQCFVLIEESLSDLFD